MAISIQNSRDMHVGSLALVMTEDSHREPASDRVQVNVTFKQITLDSLKEQFPSALDDSERVRRAVDESLEVKKATQVSLSRA